MNKNEFVMDYGCTDHIVSDRNLFLNFCEKKVVVLIANGRNLQIKRVGKVPIAIFNEKKKRKLGYSWNMYCMHRSTSLT